MLLIRSERRTQYLGEKLKYRNFYFYIMENKIIQLLDETDLHKKVVEFIRNCLQPKAIIIPGLGEYQFNTTIRTNCFEKGYLGGQPDLLIVNAHRYHQGLAIEFKTPTGKGILSTKQVSFLEKLEQAGFKCIVSNDYDLIVVELMKYFDDVIYPCRYCSNKRGYKTIEKLNNHYKYFHKCEV